MNCLSCGNLLGKPFLDLGETSLANSFLTSEQLSKPEPKYPLRVCFCDCCTLVQLDQVVNRDLLFRDYAYYTSTSPQLVEHFEAYSRQIDACYSHNPFCVEIASNDGLFLKGLKQLGWKVLGIDPASNIAAKANRDGIETLPLFFDIEVAKDIARKYGRPGVVIANNVLAHVDKPNLFLKALHELLSDDGVFVLEVQYLDELIDGLQYDNIYHEHLMYFSLESLTRLLDRNWFYPFKIENVDTQGGSVRVHCQKMRHDHPLDILNKERGYRLDKRGTFDRFASLVKNNTLRSLLIEIRNEGKSIAGYGASAKSSTLLQVNGIDFLKYMVDEAPSKIGKFTPGTHIPIYPTGMLKDDPPDYVLLTAWNYSDSIMEKESWFKGRFIHPIPIPVIL